MDNYSKFRKFLSSRDYSVAPWSEGEPLPPGSANQYRNLLKSASKILFDNDENKLGHIDNDVQLLKLFNKLDIKLNSTSSIGEDRARNILYVFRYYGEFLFFQRTETFRAESIFKSNIIRDSYIRPTPRTIPASINDKKKSDKIHDDLIAHAYCSISSLELTVIEILSRYPNGLSTIQINERLGIKSKEVVEFILVRSVEKKLVNNNGNSKTPNWRKV